MCTVRLLIADPWQNYANALVTIRLFHTTSGKGRVTSGNRMSKLRFNYYNEIGFELLFVDGHTEKQMIPKITYKGYDLVFTADLIPTVGHIPVPYIMGYDIRPLTTMKEKAVFLDEVVKNKYLLFFQHDAHNQIASLKETEKGVRLETVLDFNDI